VEEAHGVATQGVPVITINGKNVVIDAAEFDAICARSIRLEAALTRIHGIVHEPLQHKNRETQMANICVIAAGALNPPWPTAPETEANDGTT
jgi:hypothetical protein